MQAPKPYHERRPWGEFVEFARNTPCTVKMLIVNPHEALSLQTHRGRDEFWRVLSGTGTVTVGEEKLITEIGKEYFIPRGTKHRIEGGKEALTILEISFGKFEDEDIARIEDKYGRNSATGKNNTG